MIVVGALGYLMSPTLNFFTIIIIWDTHENISTSERSLEYEFIRNMI